MARVPIHDHTDLNSGGRLRPSAALVGGGENLGSGGGVTDHAPLTGRESTNSHPATAISVVDSGGYFAGTNVEAILAELAAGDTSLVTVAATGATETVDVSVARTYDLTLTANCTLTLSGAVTAEAWYLTLILRQDGVGSRTVTWPGPVVWPGGVTPTLSTAADSVDVFTLFTLDGGTVWFGFPTGGGGSPATTVESETTFGIAAAVGTDTEYARQDHTHGTPANPVTAAAISALGFVGPILISDSPSTPLVFADLIQNEAQDDLLYADIP